MGFEDSHLPLAAMQLPTAQGILLDMELPKEKEFTLTREQVYEIVWAVPVTKLAPEWGLSDVRLAKILRGMKIPLPGRGHWAKLAAGEQPRRPRLPRMDPDDQVLRVHRSPLAGMLKQKPPVVRVEEQLQEPHDAVKWLLDKLASANRDDYGRLSIGTKHYPMFHVSPAHKDRALRILDGFAKALLSRGTTVLVDRRYERGESELLAKVGRESFGLQIEEILDTDPHVLTKEEQRNKEKWGWTNFPKYDYSAKGRLRLTLTYTPYSYRKQKSWSDGEKHSLDELLGRAVVAVDEAARIAVAEREERQRRDEQRAVDERKRLRPERLRWYMTWLANDLDKMIANRERAQRIRTFLADYDHHLPTESQSERSTVWRTAASRFADRLDPLCTPEAVAKEMDPDDEMLERLIAADKAAR